MRDTDCEPTQTEKVKTLTDCFERGGVTFQPDSVAWVAAQTWCYGNSYRNSVEIVTALGLDPDMAADELRRRLKLAERAEEHLGDGTLAWLMEARR